MPPEASHLAPPRAPGACWCNNLETRARLISHVTPSLPYVNPVISAHRRTSACPTLVKPTAQRGKDPAQAGSPN